MYRFAIDIGGTFTDLVVLNEKTGETKSVKIETVPKDPTIGCMEAIKRIGLDLEQSMMFIHGTTLGTNTLLERKGSRTGLITTRGFRDVDQIARGNTTDMYNPLYTKPKPLVPRHLRMEVSERTNFEGQIIRKLNEEDCRDAVRGLKKWGVESIAVCLLFSYANPEHERKVADIIKEEYPGVAYSLSHAICREYREYERTSTTIVDAYVKLTMREYIDKLKQELVANGFAGQFLFTTRGGGSVVVEEAKRRPVCTIGSGPVGGVMGAAYLGKLLDYKNIMAIDMGGTSFDVSLIFGGEPSLRPEGVVEGFPIMLPTIDVRSIGTGGGSIAFIDAGGVLQVGPESASADPGPICYNRGGIKPTVTDADVQIGYINPNYFLGGGIKLDKNLAAKGISRHIANPLGMELVEAANGIIRIVEAKMAFAIREISVEKGYDPRDFTLLAYGGAGPMHAASLAKELGIQKVVIPFEPGNFSAWGMTTTDIVHDFTRTFVVDFDKISIMDFSRIFKGLELSGFQTLESQRISNDQMTFLRSVDMRYIGQEYTVNVPISGSIATEKDKEEIVKRFNDLYKTRYGHSHENPVQIVNFRVRAVGVLGKPKLRRINEGKAIPERASKGMRSVYFKEYKNFIKCETFERDKLLAGNSIEGPAIVEEQTSTIVVGPNQAAYLDSFGNMIIEVKS